VDEATGLNLDAGDLVNAASGATRAFDPLRDTVLPGLALLLFLLVVGACYIYAKRLAPKIPDSKLFLRNWPAALRVCLVPTLLAFALTHVFSAMSAYYNSRVANENVLEYFRTLGFGRLTSLSHAHFFAHATMYFILAALVQFSRAGSFVRLLAPLAALWAGIFDIVAWWGIRQVSPNFEILSALTGTAFSIGFILMAIAIFKEAFAKDFKHGS
jgi:hypothetical protein